MDFDIALLLLFAVVAAAGCLYFWRRYRSTVRKVTFLFNAIDNGDYSFRFAEGDKAAGDRVLNRSLNRVKDILMHARDEQMEREKYFELILDSVDTGIIVVEEGRGVVLRYNRAAQKLLQREVITHVDQIKGDDEKLLVARDQHILERAPCEDCCLQRHQGRACQSGD